MTCLTFCKSSPVWIWCWYTTLLVVKAHLGRVGAGPEKVQEDGERKPIKGIAKKHSRSLKKILQLCLHNLQQTDLRPAKYSCTYAAKKTCWWFAHTDGCWVFDGGVEMPFACSKKSRSHLQWKNTHNEKIFSAIVVVSQSLPAKHHLWIGDKEIMSRRNSPGLKKASISLSGLVWIWHSEQALLYITNLQASLALKNASESKAGFLFLQYAQRKMLFVGWEEIKMSYQMSKKFLFLLGNGGDSWPDGMPRSGTMKVSSEPVWTIRFSCLPAFTLPVLAGRVDLGKEGTVGVGTNRGTSWNASAANICSSNKLKSAAQSKSPTTFTNIKKTETQSNVRWTFQGLMHYRILLWRHSTGIQDTVQQAKLQVYDKVYRLARMQSNLDSQSPKLNALQTESLKE